MSFAARYNGETCPVWYLWAVNRGEEMLDPYCDTSKAYPEAESAGLDSICPGGVVFFSIADMSGSDEPLSFLLKVYQGYESGSIVLPAP